MRRYVRLLLPLVAVLLTYQVMAAPTPPQAPEGCIPLNLLAKADFDGDGKKDKLLGAASPSEHGYRSLLVKSAEGKRLLDITQSTYYYIVEVAEIHAPNPVIIAGRPFGNKWAALEAWMYFTGKGFERLWWDSAFETVGLVKVINPSQGEIVVLTPGDLETTYRYQAGILTSGANLQR